MSAYEINFSDPLTTSFKIPDGSYNGPGGNSSTTSLRLYGRGALEWGESVNEDLVKLLETFSSATPPSTPVHGQLWMEMQPYYYNSITHSFYVYNYSSNTWQLLSVIQATAAPTAVQGQYWFNTVSNTLYIYHKLFAQQPIDWLPRSFATGVTAPDASVRPMQMLRAFDASTHAWTSVPVVEVSNATTAPIGNRIGSLRFNTTQLALYVWSGSAWISMAGGSGGGVVYSLPPASAFTLGGIMVGDGLSVDSNGTISVTTAGQPSYPTASSTVVGGVKIGSNVTVALDGTISVAAPPVTATTSTAGLVKVGAGLSIDGSGVLSSSGGTSYTLPAADVSTLGGVKVGSGLSIDGSGVLSVTASSYTLPTASTSDLGGVKVGTGLSIDGSGVLSATEQALPTASTSVVGGVKVGTGLVVDVDGTIATAAIGSSTLVWDSATGATGPTGGPLMSTMSNGWYMVRVIDDGSKGFGASAATVYKLGSVTHPVYNYFSGSPAYILHVVYSSQEIAAFHYLTTGSAADPGSNISSMISEVYRIW